MRVIGRVAGRGWPLCGGGTSGGEIVLVVDAGGGRSTFPLVVIWPPPSCAVQRVAALVELCKGWPCNRPLLWIHGWPLGNPLVVLCRGWLIPFFVVQGWLLPALVVDALLCCGGVQNAAFLRVLAGHCCKSLPLKWGILRNQYYFTSNQYVG